MGMHAGRSVLRRRRTTAGCGPLLVAAACLCTSAGAWRDAHAQGPAGSAPAAASAAPGGPPPEPRFLIRRYAISGHSLLSNEQVQAAVAPFVGPDSRFETIQQALEALEAAYLRAGYGSVRVVVPEQDVTEGVVALQVIEARLGSVTVQGAQHSRDDAVLALLPALRTGEVVQVDELSRQLRLANDNPSRQVVVTFQRAEADAQVQAQVRVADAPPLRVALSHDNSGTEATGHARTGLLLQHANLWQRDHVLTAQLVTSPGQPEDVLIMGVAYRVPLVESGGQLDLSWGYSNVDSGQVAGLSLSGSGTVWGIRYTQLLDPAPGSDWDRRFSVGWDHRSYDNSLAALAVTPNFVLRPITLGYTASRSDPQRDLSLSASVSRNLPGGSKGTAAVLNQARAGADAAYVVWKASANLTERFSGGSSLRLAASLQYSRDVLLSAEQFGLGGADSVRGLAERELPGDRVPGDRGLRVGVEWWGADVGGRTEVEGLRLQPVVFVDAGRLWANRGGTTGERRQSAASAGVGVRVAWGRQLSVRLDVARVLRGTLLSPRGSTGSHLQALWFF